MITPEDYFNQPAMRLADKVNKTITKDFGANSIEYQYNSLGYRTYEFTNITQPYAVVFGSSHTEGIGLHYEDCWTTYLETLLDYRVYAVAYGGCSSTIIVQNLLNWLSSDQLVPEAIVLQWPPIYRMLVWDNSTAKMLTATQSDYQFETLLKSGDENFWVAYAQDIVLADKLCQEKNIPCVHMILETHESCINQIKNVADSFGVTLHLDEKVEGKSWLFDSRALDQIHHSKACHAQWAKRVHEILVKDTKVC
jgi:hypothetical protein